MKKYNYCLLHSHRYGHDFYCFSTLNKNQKLTKKLIKQLNVEFDEDREEYLELKQVEIKEL